MLLNSLWIILIVALVNEQFIGISNGMRPVPLAFSAPPSSSAFEHRIDIPADILIPEGTPIFLQKIESNHSAKMFISVGDAISFLSMISENSLLLCFDNFMKENIGSQNEQMHKRAVTLIEQNLLYLGQRLGQIYYGFNTNCSQIGFDKEGNNAITNKTDHENGKIICLVGMLTAMAEFLFIEIEKIFNQTRGVKSFFRRLNTGPFGIFGIDEAEMRYYADSVERMCNFWNYWKDAMTADHDNANLIEGIPNQSRIQSQPLKQHLKELTIKNLYDFVANQIELEKVKE